jgi:hypothetical protein
MVRQHGWSPRGLDPDLPCRDGGAVYVGVGAVPWPSSARETPPGARLQINLFLQTSDRTGHVLCGLLGSRGES